MSETLLLPPANPGLPSETKPPVANDASRAQNPAGTPTLENIRKTAGRVFSWGGQMFQKGRGRPPADGGPGKNDIPLGDEQIPPDMAPPLAENPPAPAGNRFAVYHKSIVSGVKGLLKIAAAFIGYKASQAGFSGDFVRELKSEMVPTQGPEGQELNEALEDFAANLELVLTKYNVSTEFAPEVACALSAVKLGQPIVSAIGKLNAEIERRRQTSTPTPSK